MYRSSSGTDFENSEAASPDTSRLIFTSAGRVEGPKSPLHQTLESLCGDPRESQNPNSVVITPRSCFRAVAHAHMHIYMYTYRYIHMHIHIDICVYIYMVAPPIDPFFVASTTYSGRIPSASPHHGEGPPKCPCRT